MFEWGIIVSIDDRFSLEQKQAEMMLSPVHLEESSLRVLSLRVSVISQK